MTDTIAASPVELATDLTIAWLANGNTRVSIDEIPVFLARMHQAVRDLRTGSAPAAPPAVIEGAVSARKSLASKDVIISLIDGKPYRTLRRHLSGHGLTPKQYRERYGLKADYPMVAETYSQLRRDTARRLGLGRKGGDRVSAKPAAPKPR